MKVNTAQLAGLVTFPSSQLPAVEFNVPTSLYIVKTTVLPQLYTSKTNQDHIRSAANGISWSQEIQFKEGSVYHSH